MSLELNAQDLQMGSSVYSKSNEKVGTLRFAMSIPTPPYQISQLLIDRVDGVDGGLLVNIDLVESVSNNSITSFNSTSVAIIYMFHIETYTSFLF